MRTKSVIAVAAAGILLLTAVAAMLMPGRSRSSGSVPAGTRGEGVVKESRSQPPVYTPPPETGYVGSQACAECHRSIFDSYQAHPMAHSITLAAADPAANPAYASSRIEGKTRFLQVEAHDGRMTHHERMEDVDGQLIYDQAITMDYVVGSGKRARAYLFQEGHVLFMSPLNWYSQTKQWDLAPGYVPDDPRRFDRRVTDECLSCHAGRIASVARSTNTYRDAPFHEMAIGCENCHGPGEKHVTVRSSGHPIEAGADPIVNPSRLDPVRRESVCNQCHLQTAVRLTRPGRSDLDFRPGQDVDEIWTFLDIKRSITSDGRTHSVNHVQQMHESRCFTQSKGQLGCTSCHDPHKTPTPETRASFYRERCLKCHDQTSCSETTARRHQVEDSCIACHMPARDSSNISHVTQTDHRVIRTRAPSPSDIAASDETTLTLFGDQEHRLSELERDRALGLGAWARLAKTGRRAAPDLGLFLNRVLQELPDDGLLLIALGTMAHQASRSNLAVGYLERARQIPDAEEGALAELLDIYYESSNWERALPCANRLIEINPRNAKAYALKADAISRLGKPADGIIAARRAVDLNPSLIAVRRWLVTAYRDAGRQAEADAEEGLVKRMEEVMTRQSN